MAKTKPQLQAELKAVKAELSKLKKQDDLQWETPPARYYAIANPITGSIWKIVDSKDEGETIINQMSDDELKLYALDENGIL